MSDCLGCKETILDREKSIIGSPICAECNETEVVCTGKTTYTECVTSNTSLPCIDTAIGATQTQINQAFDTKLCQISTGNCTVSVSADDDCCGYLEDKLTDGVGTTVTKPSARICETLQIDINPYVYTNLSLTSPWLNASGFFFGNTNLAVGTNGTDVIRLKGQIKYGVGLPSGTPKQIGILPVGFRPTETKYYTTSAFPSMSGAIPFLIEIVGGTGEIRATGYPGAGNPKDVTLSLDFINFTI